LLVKASGGTLLLDEIGDMPLAMQPKLLRALQQRTVRPVGSSDETPFDARIVAATHRDLGAEVEAGRFREDLYYRINVVRVEVPPLRAREGDILRLAAQFVRKFAEKSKRGEMVLSPQVAAKLLAYDWPGNVRELENCVERAVALARLDHLSAEDLPERIIARRSVPTVAIAGQPDEIAPLEDVIRRHIERALAIVGGNKMPILHHVSAVGPGAAAGETAARCVGAGSLLRSGQHELRRPPARPRLRRGGQQPCRRGDRRGEDGGCHDRGHRRGLLRDPLLWHRDRAPARGLLGALLSPTHVRRALSGAGCPHGRLQHGTA
jgi:hypothetical protein